jgi:hypothetical protein
MSVLQPIRPLLRLIAIALALSLLAGCTDAPDGIEAVSNAAALGTLPDTVAVLVDGEAVEGDLRWTPPTSKQKAWLAEHDYDRLTTRYSKADTEALWAERLRVLRGLIGKEHIPEIRHAVVHELSVEAVGRDELLGIDISDGFDADRFQERLEDVLHLQDATREEVQAQLDALDTKLDEYERWQAVGRAYYAQGR